MKKKLLSLSLAAAMSASVLAVPVWAEAVDETLTVSYEPQNWVIRYGGQYSHTGKNMLAVNQLGINKDGKSVGTRTDQDDSFSQYAIPAPNAIESIQMNIKNLPFGMKEVKTTNDDDETVTTTIEEAVMGMSIRYSTVKTALPEDGLYYLKSDTEAVGGNVEEVNNILTAWADKLFWNRSNHQVLIGKISPTEFGIEDATIQRKKYNVSRDITDVVLADLKKNQTVENVAYLETMYGPGPSGVWGKATDYYENPAENWAKSTTLEVTYSKAKIADDINSATTVDELNKKVKNYAVMLGYDSSLFDDQLINSELTKYVDKTITTAGIEEMIADVIQYDVKQHQVDLTEKYNVSNWGVVGEEIKEGTTFITGQAGSLAFDSLNGVIPSYTLKAVDVKDVKSTTDSNGNTYNTSTNVENGDVIDFEFDKSIFSANVNNADFIWKGTTDKISGFARHTKRLYLLTGLALNHKGTINVTVNYTDGTSENIAIQTINIGQKHSVNGVEGYGSYPTVPSAFPNYSGSVTVQAQGIFNSKSWAIPTASQTESYKVGESGYTKAAVGATVETVSSSAGAIFWKVDVDSSRIIKDIQISSNDATVILYAAGETVISNAEMREKIAEAEKITDAVANIETIEAAKRYADELIERNVATASDFEKLNALYAEAEWYAKKTDKKDNMIDLTKYFNADILMPLDSQITEDVAKVLNEGPASTNTAGWKRNGALAGTGSTYVNGVRTINEAVYELNEDGQTYSFVNNGNSVQFLTPETGFEAGVKDVIKLTKTDKVTIPASGEKAEKLFILWDGAGSSQDPKITVNYKDGTSETTNIKIGGWSWTLQDNNNMKNKQYPKLAGAFLFGYTKYIANKNENNEKYTVAEKNNIYNGVNMWAIELDTTKNVESYTFDNANTYNTYIYAITEQTMKNADMQAVIDEAKALLDDLGYVSTKEQMELVRTAAVYARELNARHAVKLEDNQDVLDLEVQANAQDTIYMDLSKYADMDIMVKSGDTEKYASRDDSLLVDYPETVTAVGPSDPVCTSTETGTVFKLFGGWNGKGNDAVRIKPADENGTNVEINMDGKMLKHISILADSIDTAVDASAGTRVSAKVNYTDGTSEEITFQLRRGDSWYTNQQAAHFGKAFGSWSDTDSKYIAKGKVTGTNNDSDYATAYPGRSSEGVAVTGFDIEAGKAIQSVEFIPHEKAEYAIIGLTATPYQNDELMEKYNKFIDLDLTEVNDVTADNAKDVIDGYNALEELSVRKYQWATEDDIEWFAPYKEKALAFTSDSDELKFVPSITIENGKAVASVNMLNTTSKDKPYVVIIAAYSANNQLLAVNATEQKTLSSMTYDGTDSVSVDVPQNASYYKAMVWDGIKTMVPYAVVKK